MVFSDYFSQNEPGVFETFAQDSADGRDYYMHLADLKAYLDADRQLCALYSDPNAWARKAILNVAGSGKFSSDRTIADYASEIWKVEPCPNLCGME